jgi:hypothetical protein
MSTTDSHIDKRFPKPVLTVIKHAPTHESLATLEKEINSNAMSIPSARGSGSHGHLALTITPAKYLALTGVAFEAPTNPGAAANHPAAATTAQITEANRRFDAAKIEFQTYNVIEGLLKRQVLSAVDAMYLDELNDETVGFATSTCRALLAHLRSNYGTITPDQLETNLRQLERQWQPPAPLESLFQQIKKCQRFATDGNDPITNKTAVRSVLKNVEATGLFADACRDWRKRDDTDQTLAAFKIAFSAADLERKRQTTSAAAGYHGANAARAVTPAPATSAPARPVASPAPATPSYRSANTPRNFHYCWSHGLGRNSQHTSPTCTYPKEGHQTDATLDNMMEGCRLIARPPRHPRATGTDQV